ncbi:hypothetical protein EYF80_016941 [Liparis tanakae]|uniref:Uncharacterized protein n=1 Tax=Liparis tanakae TaxID=230148 RepID=A0A4Z2I4S7_9TELE|nr:hypothetical protein EYF80_016941 [Liparis tanakae]
MKSDRGQRLTSLLRSSPIAERRRLWPGVPETRKPRPGEVKRLPDPATHGSLLTSLSIAGDKGAADRWREGIKEQGRTDDLRDAEGNLREREGAISGEALISGCELGARDGLRRERGERRSGPRAPEPTYARVAVTLRIFKEIASPRWAADNGLR